MKLQSIGTAVALCLAGSAFAVPFHDPRAETSAAFDTPTSV